MTARVVIDAPPVLAEAFMLALRPGGAGRQSAPSQPPPARKCDFNLPLPAAGINPLNSLFMRAERRGVTPAEAEARARELATVRGGAALRHILTRFGVQQMSHLHRCQLDDFFTWLGLALRGDPLPTS